MRMPRCPSVIVAILVVVAAVAIGGPARADVFDLTLERLVLPPVQNGFADPNDPANFAAGVPSAYRTVLSELGVAMAPKVLTTADTVGYNGFQFTFDYSFTNISNAPQSGCDDMHRDKCPWTYAAEGTRDANGNRGIPPGLMHTISVYVRKGIWLPFPSFEIGAGATKLLQSDMWAVQVYGKLSLHEGFHDWPIPSFAIRGSGVRVMGSSEIDLTMAQVDGIVSKSFGAAGSVTLVPYIGAGVLFIIGRGQVRDLTPNVDAYKAMGAPNSPDLNNNAVFNDQDMIVRWRFFGGLRLQYHILVFTTDLIVTPCGDWNGTCNEDRHKPFLMDAQHPPDRATTQLTFSASAGFMF